MADSVVEMTWGSGNVLGNPVVKGQCPQQSIPLPCQCSSHYPRFVVVQTPSCVWLFAAPWTGTHQSPPSFTISSLSIQIFPTTEVIINCSWLSQCGASQVMQWSRICLPVREMQETWVQSWVRKITWTREQQSAPWFLPRNLHQQRSLAGYHSWGHREAGMAEWLSRHTEQCNFLYKGRYIYLFLYRAHQPLNLSLGR